MATESADVYVAALSLPEANRADLAYKLLQSLRPATVMSENDSEFEDELERRASTYDAGETSASDWDTVSARLRKALRDRTVE